MIYLQLFWAFFISNILGYGGGPPSIPLVQNEVVNQFGWMTLKEFGDMLAIANALPGPIATKMAAFVGFQVGGVLGSLVALFATVAPSAIAMILLFRSLDVFKDAPQVKAMSRSVQPVVAVLLGVLSVQFFVEAVYVSGWMHTGILATAGYILMEVVHIHPAVVIAGALAYGAVFLS